jgi:ATP-binding cassette subfamily F protein 3
VEADQQLAADTGDTRAEQRRKAAEMRAQLVPLRKRMQQAEKAVSNLQKQIEKMDAELADPDIYTNNSTRAKDLMRERGTMAKKLEELEFAWLQAADDYETASVVT